MLWSLNSIEFITKMKSILIIFMILNLLYIKAEENLPNSDISHYSNGNDVSSNILHRIKQPKHKHVVKHKKHAHHHRNKYQRRNGDEKTSTTDTVVSVIGKTVELNCVMDNFTRDEKIVWLRMPRGEVLTLNSNKIVQDTRIYSKCNQNIVPCWILVIESVKDSDTGYYVCQTNAMQTKYIYLDVMVPPQLINSHLIDRIDINENSNLTLTCETYGKPAPKLSWFKGYNGTYVEIEKFYNSKTISYLVTRDSNTELECVADNGVPPTVSKKILINIKFAPRVDFSNNRVYQKQGRDVIIDCITHSNPEPKVVWLKDNTEIIDSTKHALNLFQNRNYYFYRLFIREVEESDFGSYSCKASNELGEAQSNVELIELSDPSVRLNRIKTTTHQVPLITTGLNGNNYVDNTDRIEQRVSGIYTQLPTIDNIVGLNELKYTDKPKKFTNRLKSSKIPTIQNGNYQKASSTKGIIYLKEQRRKLEASKADLKMIELTASSTRLHMQSGELRTFIILTNFCFYLFIRGF